MRQLTMRDIGEAWQRSAEWQWLQCEPIVDLMRSVEDVCGADGAGIPRRGTSVWYDILGHEKWTIDQLAAAHVWLRARGCDRRILDAIEITPAKPDDAFALANDPPAHRPAKFSNQPDATQRVLIEGMGCLPGQLDLF